EIAVGVELAFVPEHADLVLPGKDDAAVAVLEFTDLTDELLGHAAAPPWTSRCSLLGRPAGDSRPQRRRPMTLVYYNCSKATSGSGYLPSTCLRPQRPLSARPRASGGPEVRGPEPSALGPRLRG